MLIFLPSSGISKYNGGTFLLLSSCFPEFFKLQNEIKKRNGDRPFPHFEYYLRHVYKKLKVEGIDEFLIEDELRNYRMLE